ncbi:MAG: hypothetical protein R2883_06385 [Caldisericia bacterium]
MKGVNAEIDLEEKHPRNKIYQLKSTERNSTLIAIMSKKSKESRAYFYTREEA